MRKNVAAIVLVVSASAGAGACGLVFDTDALERGGSPIVPEGGAIDSGTDDAGEDAPASCPAAMRGPKLVPTGGAGECIDATEVTVGDYDAFEKQQGSLLPFSDPDCKWVTTLRPTTFDTQLQTPLRPVVDVNYCHAFHYCKWAGKHLCGRVGGGGGAIAPGDAGMNVQENQWLRACTRGGTQSYSYGKNVVVGLCKTAPMSVVDVGTRGACKGPYPDLFDMLGNVGEWIDACANDGVTRQRDGCTALGTESIRDEASCWDHDELSRYWEAPNLGFRCCGP